jgi:hypothetical protein
MGGKRSVNVGSKKCIQTIRQKNLKKRPGCKQQKEVKMDVMDNLLKHVE